MYWAPPARTQLELYDALRRSVNIIWRKTHWADQVCDDRSQWLLIHTLSEKYVYPRYIDLVGPPSSSDYTDDGGLSITRKATLLLLGTIQWNDLIIAKAPAVFGYNLRGRPNWSVDQNGWYVAHQYQPIEHWNPSTGILEPLTASQVERLPNYLLRNEGSRQRRHMAIPINGNDYDCRPKNLRVISTRGRAMRCKHCGRRVTPDGSRRFQVDRISQRYCLPCMHRFATDAEHQCT